VEHCGAVAFKALLNCGKKEKNYGLQKAQQSKLGVCRQTGGQEGLQAKIPRVRAILFTFTAAYPCNKDRGR